MVLSFGIRVGTTAYGLLGENLERFGTGFQAGRVTVSLTAAVSPLAGRRIELAAPGRRVNGRGGEMVDSGDRGRVLNLVLADDSLLYVVTPDIGSLRTPFWVGTTCRGFEVVGFWRVILSASEYEKDVTHFPESSESPVSSSSPISKSDMIRGSLEGDNGRERTGLSRYESEPHEAYRK